MRDRYIGEEVIINPSWEKSKLIWTTNEHWTDSNGKPKSSPSFWFEFDGWMYYGIVDYQFGMFETYDDWQIGVDAVGVPVYFNPWEPKKTEFDFLVDFKAPMNKVNDPGLAYKTRYYKLEYEKAMEGDLGHWCQFEINFTTKWNRDKKIKDIGL